MNVIRALVGANLNGKAKLQIDLTAIKSIANVKRDTMHVQGISYWAPANIGPYSQSVVVCIHKQQLYHEAKHSI